MRAFLRHPSDIPVDVRIIQQPQIHNARLHDVSGGGVCCRVNQPIFAGSQIEFAVPSLCRDFIGRGVVVWCQEREDIYHVGIQFNSQRDTFQARLVEQLCQIEIYRREVQQQEDRCLSSEQAAAEWVERHAEEFNRHFPLS